MFAAEKQGLASPEPAPLAPHHIDARGETTTYSLALVYFTGSRIKNYENYKQNPRHDWIETKYGPAKAECG
jgi:hypothetical protein